MLNLSFNNIRKIEHLPASLEELYLNGNEINEVSISAAKPLKNVIHVGLNMNKLRQPALTQLVKVFPNLFCLDVSFNDLSDLQTTVSWLKKLASLKMLSVEGNPLILAPNCTNVLKESLPGLKMIDGNTVFHDKNGDTQKMALQTSSTLTRMQSELSGPGGEPSEDWADQAKSMTLDLQFRLLREIEGGRYLIPDENCTFDVEKLDSLTDEQKSSQFWLTYTDHNGNQLSTAKRSYLSHFQVTDVDGKVTAKTDVEYKIRVEEAPSIEMRDWMYNDLVVELWESRPKLQKVQEEGSEIEVDRVVVDAETGIPETETLSRGILKVNFAKWLKKSPANPQY